jgi:hypothetical protein
MSDQSDQNDPLHLDGRHRDTLSQIFQHPVNHNITWTKALSLLEAVGTVEQEHDGRYKVHVGDETEVLNRPHDKDLTEQQVVDLRRMLHSAGLQPKPKGKEV